MTINAISSQNLSEVSFGKKHDVEKTEKKHHKPSKETTAKILTALAGLAVLGAGSVLVYKNAGKIKKTAGKITEEIKTKIKNKKPEQTQKPMTIRQVIAEQRLADIRKMDSEIAQSEARVAPKFHQMKQKTYEDMFKDLPDTGNLFEKDLPVMKRSEFMERYSA